MSSTWISRCDPDVEDTMDRSEALELAITELGLEEQRVERQGLYNMAAQLHNARAILERIRDEIEE